MRDAFSKRMRTCIGMLAMLGAALPAQAADLIVSAASSLSNAFRELAPAFEAANPGSRLAFNFAASDTLLTQIANGAPVDVLASADEVVMDRAVAAHLLKPESRRDFIGNSMVLITPHDSSRVLRSLPDLLNGGVTRVALGRPASVPAGRYAQSALNAAGIWKQIEPKTIYAQNVRQCLDYVARGEVDAGFVYGSDAALMPDRVKVEFVVRTTSPVRYPIAIVAGSANIRLAQRFIDLATSPAGQAVLLRHGFVPP